PPVRDPVPPTQGPAPVPRPEPPRLRLPACPYPDLVPLPGLRLSQWPRVAPAPDGPDAVALRAPGQPLHRAGRCRPSPDPVRPVTPGVAGLPRIVGPRRALTKCLLY